MAIALALHRNGVESEIVDARARGAAKEDKRILALSHGARQILEWLGVWNTIPHTAITTIHISHQGGLGRTRLTAEDEGVPALGYVLAAGDLATALDVALVETDIVFREHTKVDEQPDTPLTIWAEGAVDDESAIVRDYGQHGVICTATADEPHAGRAWERFTPEGPVAALPWGKDYAVVMTCAAAQSTQVGALGDAEFVATLQRRFGGRVRFTSVGERFVFPLGLRYRKSVVATRQVWIGNAAQTLHPVAGQGFNLALRDIYELARTLTDAQDPGAPELLARYDAARKLDRNGAMRFTDTLVHLFSNDDFLLRHARGAGLLALDLLPPARHFVARRMMFGARGW
ncbi:MAG: FAD-dependent monooxygenase [Gammaproteobacteria bacterium]|nr:FAD-dependent monooxygenase [Gammaproteobacteria bacterium]MBU1415135.1 FAD-dependent monooxygenase [Gammaproteobacteria bacterium]